MKETKTIFNKMEDFVNSKASGTFNLTRQDCLTILKQLDSMDQEIVDLDHLSARMYEDIEKTKAYSDYGICSFEDDCVEEHRKYETEKRI